MMKSGFGIFLWNFYEVREKSLGLDSFLPPSDASESAYNNMVGEQQNQD
jgi:hypothetical protein